MNITLFRSSISIGNAEEKNEFRAGIVSWGEQSMISSSELFDSTTGFIVNNSLIVQADFILLKIEVSAPRPLRNIEIPFE